MTGSSIKYNMLMIQWAFPLALSAVWCIAAFLLMRFPGGLWLILSVYIAAELIVFVLFKRAIRPIFWNLCAPWLAGVCGSFLFFVFIDRAMLRFVWIIVVAYATLLYWYQAAKQDMLFGGNQSGRVSTSFRELVTVWLALGIGTFGASLYAWQILGGANGWFISVFIIALTGFLTWSLRSFLENPNTPLSFIFIIIFAIISLESFWVIGFGTLGFMSKALLWASGVWYGWWLYLQIMSQTASARRVWIGTGSLIAFWIIMFVSVRWF